MVGNSATGFLVMLTFENLWTELAFYAFCLSKILGIMTAAVIFSGLFQSWVVFMPYVGTLSLVFVFIVLSRIYRKEEICSESV